MNELASMQRPVGACAQCGGVLSAAHMLTKAYEVDNTGHWTRSLAEFTEDVVVVCRECGADQDGRIAEEGGAFAFVRGTSIE